MKKRDLKKDMAFMEMLSDEVIEKIKVDGVEKTNCFEKVKSNVKISCYSCRGQDFNISGEDGTVLQCKKCETAISISFLEQETQG